MSKFWKTIVEALESLTPGPDRALITPEMRPGDGRATLINPSNYPNVPSKWKWILAIPGLPRLVSEGLKEVGTLEGAGTANNRKIIAWADEIQKFYPTPYTNWAGDWYNKDSVPWCGVYMAVVVARASLGLKDRMPVNSYLSALAWSNFGVGVNWQSSKNNIWCGDLAIFTRDGGGHVAIVLGVSKDGLKIVCLGGNQDDAVNIKLISVSRLYAVRRVPYKTKPLGAKHIRIDSTGIESTTRES